MSLYESLLLRRMAQQTAKQESDADIWKNASRLASAESNRQLEMRKLAARERAAQEKSLGMPYSETPFGTGSVEDAAKAGAMGQEIKARAAAGARKAALFDKAQEYGQERDIQTMKGEQGLEEAKTTGELGHARGVDTAAESGWWALQRAMAENEFKLKNQHLFKPESDPMKNPAFRAGMGLQSQIGEVADMSAEQALALQSGSLDFFERSGLLPFISPEFRQTMSARHRAVPGFIGGGGEGGGGEASAPRSNVVDMRANDRGEISVTFRDGRTKVYDDTERARLRHAADWSRFFGGDE